MNILLKFKLWLAYRLGLKPLLNRPDIVIKVLLEKYTNQIVMAWGVEISQFMIAKVGIKRWETLVVIIALRIKHFLDGLRAGLKDE